MDFKPIARMHSVFPTKFGVPRQSGLAAELDSLLVPSDCPPQNWQAWSIRRNLAPACVSGERIWWTARRFWT